MCIHFANENKQSTSLMKDLICGLRCGVYPDKPDIRRRPCSLIPIHRTVRMIRFLVEMQDLVRYMKAFDAGEFIGQRLDCIIYKFRGL